MEGRFIFFRQCFHGFVFRIVADGIGKCDLLHKCLPERCFDFPFFALQDDAHDAWKFADADGRRFAENDVFQCFTDFLLADNGQFPCRTVLLHEYRRIVDVERPCLHQLFKGVAQDFARAVVDVGFNLQDFVSFSFSLIVGNEECAENAGSFGVSAFACAKADAFDAEKGRKRVGCSQCACNRSTSRGDEFPCGIHDFKRHAAGSHDVQRSWHRYGQAAMLAADSACAFGKLWHDDFGNAKAVEADGSGNDIHDGIGSADFVEVDLIDRKVVCFRFCFRNEHENLLCDFTGMIRHGSAVNDRHDIRQIAVFMMVVMAMNVVMIMIMALFAMEMRAVMFFIMVMMMVSFLAMEVRAMVFFLIMMVVMMMFFTVFMAVAVVLAFFVMVMMMFAVFMAVAMMFAFFVMMMMMFAFFVMMMMMFAFFVVMVVVFTLFMAVAVVLAFFVMVMMMFAVFMAVAMMFAFFVMMMMMFAFFVVMVVVFTLFMAMAVVLAFFIMMVMVFTVFMAVAMVLPFLVMMVMMFFRDIGRNDRIRAVEVCHVMVVVFMFCIEDDIEVATVDAGFLYAGDFCLEALHRKGSECCFQCFLVSAQIKHGSNEHISADAGTGFQI